MFRPGGGQKIFDSLSHTTPPVGKSHCRFGSRSGVSLRDDGWSAGPCGKSSSAFRQSASILRFRDRSVRGEFIIGHAVLVEVAGVSSITIMDPEPDPHPSVVDTPKSSLNSEDPEEREGRKHHRSHSKHHHHSKSRHSSKHDDSKHSSKRHDKQDNSKNDTDAKHDGERDRSPRGRRHHRKKKSEAHLDEDDSDSASNSHSHRHKSKKHREKSDNSQQPRPSSRSATGDSSGAEDNRRSIDKGRPEMFKKQYNHHHATESAPLTQKLPGNSRRSPGGVVVTESAPTVKANQILSPQPTYGLADHCESSPLPLLVNQDEVTELESYFQVDAHMMIDHFKNAFVTVTKNLKKPNVLIVGITGVGKSSLINSVFRSKMAVTGSGKVINIPPSPPLPPFSLFF